MVLNIARPFRLFQVDPMQAAVHGTGHEAFFFGKGAKGKNLCFGGGNHFAGFRVVQVPFHQPAIAPGRKNMTGIPAGSKGINSGAVAGTGEFFLNGHLSSPKKASILSASSMPIYDWASSVLAPI